MFAVIFIPNFSLQAVLRHEPELRSRAVALIDSALSKPVVFQISDTARESGVCAGLTASQAQARCGNIIIKARSLAQEQAATEIMLQTAYAFSPNIESTALGVCTMDLKGLPVAAVYDRQPNDGDAHRAPLQNWSENILQTLARFYLEAQIGFGVTPELALLAARTERGCPVNFLPIAALEPPPEIFEILKRWGIRTVGELIALQRNEVAERLGAAALELFDRVLPSAIRPLNIIKPSETFAEEMDFEVEVETTEALLFALRRFVEQLVLRISFSYRVVSELQLRLSLSSGEKYEHNFKIPAPTSRLETLFRALQTHLENLRTDSPIVSLRLEAVPCQPQLHQFSLFESTLRDPNQFAETLARLTALCEPERVGTPKLQATHKPDSFQMRAPEFDGARVVSTRSSNGFEKTLGKSLEPVSLRGCCGLGQTALQLRRFRPALPAHIECREQRPALLRSSIFNGPIADVRGPFSSSGNWWDQNGWSRLEWDVQADDGVLYRLVKQDSGWFVEGVYD